MLAAGHQPLQRGRVRITVDVHQKRRWHEVRCAQRLLVDHVVVRIADQRPIVGVEEHLVRHLLILLVAALVREYRHLSVRVGAREHRAVRRPLAVEDRSVALAGNLVVEHVDAPTGAEIPQENAAVIAAAEEDARIGRMRFDHEHLVFMLLEDVLELAAVRLPHLDAVVIRRGDRVPIVQ